MKAPKQIGRRLMVVFFLATGLITNSHAQLKPPLQIGTFFSAKDPGGMPLPFNPHPDLEAVEVEKGIFVVDDTDIPDTAAEIASRVARQAAQARAKTVDPKVAQAAQEATWRKNREAAAPWLIQDVPMADGSQLTAEKIEAQRRNNLQSLATSIAGDFVKKQAAIAAFTKRNPNIAASSTDADGNTTFIEGFDLLGAPLFKAPFGLESAQTISADKLWTGGSSGFNDDGTNAFVFMWESGDVLTNHQEFWYAGYPVRLLTKSGTVSAHATQVAGVILSYGAVGAAYKGIANRGKAQSSLNSLDFLQMPGQAATNGMKVSNHSYGIQAGWFTNASFGTTWVWGGDSTVSTNQDWKFGFYDSLAQTNDQIIYNAQTYLPVFADTEARGFQPPTQPFSHLEFQNGVRVTNNTVRPLNTAQAGFNNLTSYAVSKNALVVGATAFNTNGYTGTNSVVMSTFSSWGPCADGRIKPDITAAGVSIITTTTIGSSQTITNQYGFASGTSFAAPAAAGAIGLLLDLYGRIYPTNAPLLSGTNAPLASTLRGLVIHTADQTGTNLGPNYMFGWGQLNALSCANLISNNNASGSLANIKEVRLMSGDYVEFQVTLTNTKPFKVTIAWTDPAGTPTVPAINPTNHMLVNDLDLRVVSSGGTTNFPWVLNPASPASAATKANNTVDNVEQVSIPSPTSGTYLVRVTHKGNLVSNLGQTTNQTVSILLSGNTAQPPILPQISSIISASSNSVILTWSSDVGRIYRVQYVNDLSATNNNWQYASGELSATKTNTAVTLDVTGVTNQFYRVVQLR